jgi:phosphoribosylpyrophosphate synthetase
MATHAVFTAATGEVLATDALDGVVVTDTVAADRVDLGPARRKLTVVSTAQLLASAIRALHDERSLCA